MRLYINVDHVATVRQARRAHFPDPIEAAKQAVAGGADGITVHLREDRRHIQDDDVRRLSDDDAIATLNLELALAPDIIALALELRPEQVTFVPEKREEITTEGGLDLRRAGNDSRLKDAVDAMKEAGIRTSLFIDADPESIRLSADLQPDAIELHTGAYANDPGAPHQLEQLRVAASQARKAGLAVHAGHGLDYQNVGPVAAITEIEELNIGHSIVARALTTGMQAAVAEMRRVIDAR